MTHPRAILIAAVLLAGLALAAHGAGRARTQATVVYAQSPIVDVDAGGSLHLGTATVDGWVGYSAASPSGDVTLRRYDAGGNLAGTEMIPKGTSVRCVNNLKKIALALHTDPDADHVTGPTTDPSGRYWLWNEFNTARQQYLGGWAVDTASPQAPATQLLIPGSQLAGITISKTYLTALLPYIDQAPLYASSAQTGSFALFCAPMSTQLYPQATGFAVVDVVPPGGWLPLAGPGAKLPGLAQIDDAGNPWSSPAGTVTFVYRTGSVWSAAIERVGQVDGTLSLPNRNIVNAWPGPSDKDNLVVVSLDAKGQPEIGWWSVRGSTYARLLGVGDAVNGKRVQAIGQVGPSSSGGHSAVCLQLTDGSSEVDVFGPHGHFERIAGTGDRVIDGQIREIALEAPIIGADDREVTYLSSVASVEAGVQTMRQSIAKASPSDGSAFPSDW